MTIGRGVAGRWEISLELDPAARGRGLGRVLIAKRSGARLAVTRAPGTLRGHFSPFTTARVAARRSTPYVPSVGVANTRVGDFLLGLVRLVLMRTKGSNWSTTAAGSGLTGALANTVRAAGGKVIGVIPEGLVRAQVALRRWTIYAWCGPCTRATSSWPTSSRMRSWRCPGGFGTFEELLEIVTCAQLGTHSKPIGLLNVAGYYDHLLGLVQQAVSDGFIAADHIHLVYVDNQPARLLARACAHETRVPVRTWLDRTEV